MAVTVSTQDGIRFIRLRDEVDIAQAAELKCALLDALASSRQVRIQVGGLSAIDVTIVQLLLAAGSHPKSAGSDLIFEGPLSGAVDKSLSGTGISPLLASLLVPSEEEAARVLASRN